MKITTRLGWLLILTSIYSLTFGFVQNDIILMQNQIVNFDERTAKNIFNEQAHFLPTKKYQDYFFGTTQQFKYRHLFYKHKVNNYNIVSQMFFLDANNETVILSHGYLDHSGFNQNIVNFLISNQYNVIMFDQPGHGLSSGTRSDIDSFNTYQDVLLSTIEKYQPHLNQPIHVIGHSTGNVGIMDSINNNQKNWTGKTIMLAPLIRSKVWKTSKFFYKLGGGLLEEIPRKFRNNSHDKSFKKWLKNEPFVIKKISKNWIDEHHAWEEKIQNNKINLENIVIIQGQRDYIVDYKYNQKYLLKYFPNAKLIKIKKSNHHLTNETLEIQNDVFEQILSILKHKKSD